MCVLPDADSGCLAATEMQLKIAALPAVADVKRAIRVGFHAGPVIEEASDVFGDTVNLAARMAGLAKGMQIITTQVTVERLSAPLRASTRKIAALVGQGQGRRHRGLRSDLAGRRGPHDDDAVDRRRRGPQRASSDARRAEARAGAGELDRIAGPRRRAARSFWPTARLPACTPASSAAATSSSWSIRAPTAPSSRSGEKPKSRCGARR